MPVSAEICYYCFTTANFLTGTRLVEHLALVALAASVISEEFGERLAGYTFGAPRVAQGNFSEAARLRSAICSLSSGDSGARLVLRVAWTRRTRSE